MADRQRCSEGRSEHSAEHAAWEYIETIASSQQSSDSGIRPTGRFEADRTDRPSDTTLRVQSVQSDSSGMACSAGQLMADRPTHWSVGQSVGFMRRQRWTFRLQARVAAIAGYPASPASAADA